jgi:uncharacterized protein YbjT (DUF2867 family)
MVVTILVTGVTGTVGSEVIKQASNYTDVNVKAAARSVNRIINLEGDRVKTVALDYNKPESMKEALKDVDSFSCLLQMHQMHMNLHLIWSMKRELLESDIL